MGTRRYMVSVTDAGQNTYTLGEFRAESDGQALGIARGMVAQAMGTRLSNRRKGGLLACTLPILSAEVLTETTSGSLPYHTVGTFSTRSIQPCPGTEG
jgi:hypothetical protein